MSHELESICRSQGGGKATEQSALSHSQHHLSPTEQALTDQYNKALAKIAELAAEREDLKIKLGMATESLEEYRKAQTAALAAITKERDRLRDQKWDYIAELEARLTAGSSNPRAPGEAWMMCNNCGSKLYSFDGDKDASRNCPYKDVDGKCTPEA